MPVTGLLSLQKFVMALMYLSLTSRGSNVTYCRDGVNFAHEKTVTFRCRLRHDKNGGAWCPKHMVTREALEYLEVNLHTMHVVVAVQTQGRFGNGMGQEYAEVYMLEYWRPSFNSNMWARWKDRSGRQVSSGSIYCMSEEQRVFVFLL
jgi:discoidin domain receptor family protein 2